MACSSSYFFKIEYGYQCTMEPNCPLDMPFKVKVDTQTQCLDKCPDPTSYSQDFECVEKCVSGAYVEDNGKYICVGQCPRFYIAQKDAVQCVDSCRE